MLQLHWGGVCLLVSLGAEDEDDFMATLAKQQAAKSGGGGLQNQPTEDDDDVKPDGASQTPFEASGAADPQPEPEPSSCGSADKMDIEDMGKAMQTPAKQTATSSHQSGAVSIEFEPARPKGEPCFSSHQPAPASTPPGLAFSQRWTFITGLFTKARM